MKRALSLLLLVSVSAPFSVQANSIQTIFKSNSVLPVELQSELYLYLVTQCPGYVIPYGVKETHTSFMAKDFDNGTVYYQYTTNLTSVYYLNGDARTIAVADIVVEASSSVKMDGSAIDSIGKVMIDGTECKRKEVLY